VSWLEDGRHRAWLRARPASVAAERMGPPIDLSRNENPWGPSPRAVEAARRALSGAHRYPDGSLLARLAQHLGVPEPRVLLGSGSSEIIGLIVQALCGPGDEVLAPARSFACYRMSCEAHRRAFREAASGPAFSCDVDGLLAAAGARTAVVFLANPNNPTGTYVGRSAFERLVDGLPAHVTLAVDEAYLEYAEALDYPDALQYLGRRERLISLRTFSKVYGLAGLRVGYAVGPEPLIASLHRARLPFTVNAVGQAAAGAALEDTEHVQRSRQVNSVERRRLEATLRSMGADVVPSQTNFLMVRPPGPGREGQRVSQALLRRGVRVQPLEDHYGLPFHLRITVGTPSDNAHLLSALRGVLGD
jgi:histidinol-phosphate aminotransferase